MKYALGVLAFLVAIYLFGSFASVASGHRGVQTRFGQVQAEVLPEGLHYVGFFTNVHEMTVQTQKIQVVADAASKDLQSIKATIALNSRLDPAFVKETYQQLTKDYAERIINPAIEESVKAVTASFTADEMIVKREQVKQGIVAELKERLEPRHIAVDDVLIVDFSFSEKFNQAIENKVKAEQDALAQKNKLEEVKYLAQQQVETAKAQAETIRIQAEAVNKQGGADYVRLKAIEKWDGRLPQYQLGGGVTPFVDLQGLK